jgi:hypothetical protein
MAQSRFFSECSACRACLNQNFSSTASMSQIKKLDFLKFSAAVRSNGDEQLLVTLNIVLERSFSFLATIKKLREDSGEAFLKLFKRKSIFKETEVVCNIREKLRQIFNTHVARGSHYLVFLAKY